MGHGRRAHLLDLRGGLPVLELPGVVVVTLAVALRVDVQPAEEDVAGGLRRSLRPVTTRSPWFENPLGPRGSSSTDASACLICRNTDMAVKRTLGMRLGTLKAADKMAA